MALTEDGNWYEIVSALPAMRPALFLDRDGVVIEEQDYLDDPDAVQLVAGVAPVMRAFRESGFGIVLVTNQSGIGRGYFSWDAFLAVQARLAQLLAEQGAGWDMALACPYHPTHGIAPYRGDNAWRKPKPGMIAFSAGVLATDLPNSILVGDKLSDLEAGEAGGVGLLCHVETGHGAAERADVLGWPGRQVMRLPSLADLAVPVTARPRRNLPGLRSPSAGQGSA